MRITPKRPCELGERELGAWRTMQRRDASLENPFLSPEFTLAVGRQRPATRVAVLERGGRPVGFFPFERRRLGMGRPVGAGLSDCHGVIHDGAAEWDPEALLRACGLAAWEFDHLVAAQAPFRRHHEAVQPCPVMDLSQGYDAYLADVRRNSRRFVGTTQRLGRKLAREVGALELVFDDPSAAAHETVLRWKSDQYRRSGWRDVFSRPWARALVADLLATRADGFGVLCTSLYAGGRLVAGQINLHGPRVVASWIVAYGPEFGRYSPGSVCDLMMAEAAAARGVRHVNLGKGETQQKLRLGTATVTVAEGWVRRPGPRALARGVVRTPVRAGRAYVLANPPLRAAVRTGLRTVGALRGEG